MLQTAFVDNELIFEVEKLKLDSSEVDSLEEWKYLKNCLDLGLSISDLEKLQYTDVAKIMIVTLKERSENNDKSRKATQEDIDRYLK